MQSILLSPLNVSAELLRGLLCSSSGSGNHEPSCASGFWADMSFSKKNLLKQYLLFNLKDTDAL
jgi:hypothetical protein